jgi:hypothetical protein
MTTPLADLDVQIERLLAFMNDVGRQVEACWVTLTSLPVDETSLLDWPAARAYYVIGRTPQVLDSQHYVNPYPRYAGAQRLVTSGRRYGIHVRVVAYHDDQVGRILLAGYAAADPTTCRRYSLPDPDAKRRGPPVLRLCQPTPSRSWRETQQFTTFQPQIPINSNGGHHALWQTRCSVDPANLELGLLLDNPAAIEAMRQFVAQIVNRPLDQVSTHGSTAYTWRIGYDCYCAGQTVPAGTIPAGQDYIDFVSVPCAVRIYRSNQVELARRLAAGPLLHPRCRGAGRAQEQATAAAQSIAWLLTQQRLITTLTAAGAPLIHDQITPAGRLAQFQIGG